MPATGLWVKVAATLPRHYKTENLSKALSLPTHEVVGKLVSLWIYAVEFANTGLLTMDDIRRGFLSADEPQDYKSVMTVIQALCDCGMPHHLGFLEPAEIPSDEIDGQTQTWLLHDWDDYSGTYQPGMVREDNGERSFKSYKKKKNKTLKEENKEELKTADNSSDRAGQEQAGEKSALLKQERYTLPRVQSDLVRSRGSNFNGVRRSLDAALQSLRETIEQKASATSVDAACHNSGSD